MSSLTQNRDKTFEFKENCIDLIRLVAAITVMLSHSFRWFEVEKPIWLLCFTDGSVGVIAFNALSGFLIFASWERCRHCEQTNKLAIKKYAINRALRIYPALIASCILICVFDFAVRFHGLVFNAKTPLNIFLYCTIAHNSEPILGGYSNGVLWTLFNEIILYCLIPVFYNLLMKLSKRQFLSFIFLCWVFNVFDFAILKIPVLNLFSIWSVEEEHSRFSCMSTL